MLDRVNGTRAYEQQPLGAMRSSVAWALLGLVIERPSYGYELVQRFRRTYGETLALSSAKQLYTALDTLKLRALIEEIAAPIAKQSRRPKPHYRATAEGLRAYEEWLLVQIEEERQRGRLFARQLAMLEPEAALEVIDRYEEECLTDADEISPAETAREGVANRLAEQDEQLTLEARLSWIRYAREELAELLEERAREGGQQ
jgi:DNA-binding PadR family transcriptional regulator